jgi:hypothetical protein
VTPEPSDAGYAIVPPQLRLLAVLVGAQGVVMIAYAAADLVLALVNGVEEWGAVWFLVIGLGAWGLGLLAVARGLVRLKRWAFTPVVFTQLMFAVVSISFFGAATTPAKLVWGTVLIVAVVVLRLAFARDVREALIAPPVG